MQSLSLRRLILCLLPCVLLALPAAGKAPAPTALPPLNKIPLLAPAAAAARRAGLPLDSIHVSNTPVTANREGDAVTFAVTAVEEKRQRQWIIQLLAKGRNPAEPAVPIPEWRLHLSTGSEIVFPAGLHENIAIHILGPVRSDRKEDQQVRDLWSGALVPGDFTRLGLHGMPRLLNRIKAWSTEHGEDLSQLQPAGLYIRGTPFPPEEVAKGRAWSAKYQITAEEERAFAAFMPAATSFFAVASQTNGLRDILFELVDIPWWKLISNGGLDGQIRVEGIHLKDEWKSEEWGLPAGDTVYNLGVVVHLFGKPALLMNMVMTNPRPPLYVSAGVLAFSAASTTGKGPVLQVRLLAATTPPPAVACPPFPLRAGNPRAIVVSLSTP